jgi:predicted DNA-binding protein (MmcQ/YjbR family)
MTAQEQEVAKKLRAICLALPGTEETSNHGHPTFKVKRKAYAVLHGPEGEPAIAVKVGKDMQAVFLRDARFYRTPHAHQHGYVSLHAKGKLDWDEVAELVQGSYGLSAAPKKRKT